MIPASYLYKDTLRQAWGRDFPRNGVGLAGLAHVPRHDRTLITLAFGPRRGR